MADPSIDWELARRVSRLTSARLPDIGRPEVVRLVADLGVTAKRAGRIATQYLGVAGEGATQIRIVDWEGWARAVEAMTTGLIDPPKHYSILRGIGNGLLIGLVLGRVGSRLLGQYDGLSGDTLYLVAPSLLEHERRLGLSPADFRCWVALHEQAHAGQFRLAPWLRDYLVGRMRVLLDDESHLVEGVRGWVETGEASALFVSEEARGALADLTAAMTFLEGHADLVADTAGAPHIPSVGRLRRTFDRSGAPTLFSRLAGSLDKSTQYRDGMAFCREVRRRAGHDTLTAAFVEPANLPSRAELAEPSAWLGRVHG